MKLECNCCGAWIHAHCEQLCDDEFRLLCTLDSVDFLCSLCCCREKSWSATLRSHANKLYTDVVDTLAERMALQPDQVDVLHEKVFKEEYANIASFCRDVRQLSNDTAVTESVFSSTMPWLRSVERAPLVQQNVTATVKVIVTWTLSNS